MPHYYDLDELVTLSDIAKMFNVTNSAVSNWQARYPDSFPMPVKEWNLNCKLWDRRTIQRWYKENHA